MMLLCFATSKQIQELSGAPLQTYRPAVFYTDRAEKRINYLCEDGIEKMSILLSPFAIDRQAV